MAWAFDINAGASGADYTDSGGDTNLVGGSVVMGGGSKIDLPGGYSVDANLVYISLALFGLLLLTKKKGGK